MAVIKHVECGKLLAYAYGITAAHNNFPKDLCPYDDGSVFSVECYRGFADFEKAKEEDAKAENTKG